MPPSDQTRHASQRCAPGRVIRFMSHIKIPHSGVIAQIPPSSSAVQVLTEPDINYSTSSLLRA